MVRYLAVVMLGIVGAVTVPAAAQATVGDGWVQLINSNSDKALAVAAGSDANGAAVIQYTSMPIYDQDWWIMPRAGGYVTLRNRGTGDWKALAVPASSTAQGTKLIQYTYNGSYLDQQWEIMEHNDILFHYRLKNRASGLCLAIPGGSLSNSTQVVQWSCASNSPDQYWYENDN